MSTFELLYLLKILLLLLIPLKLYITSLVLPLKPTKFQPTHKLPLLGRGWKFEYIKNLLFRSYKHYQNISINNKNIRGDFWNARYSINIGWALIDESVTMERLRCSVSVGLVCASRWDSVAAKLQLVG
jgi:hypothetical protein